MIVLRSDSGETHVRRHATWGMYDNALSETLALFSAKYPHVTLRITDGYTSELLQMQRAGQLDLVVINASAKRDEYQQIDLISEDLVVVGPADMAMPDDEIRFETIDHRRLVIPSPRHGLRAVLDEAAERHGVKLLPHYEFDEISTIENFIVNTGFQTILPPLAVANALRSGLLRCVPLSPRISRQLVGVHHTARPLSHAATMFVEALRERLVVVQQELRL